LSVGAYRLDFQRRSGALEARNISLSEVLTSLAGLNCFDKGGHGGTHLPFVSEDLR